MIKAADNLRLLQAWIPDDKNPKRAVPIVPTNKRFAENVIAPTDVVPPLPAESTAPPVGNPKLFRVSTGHGGLSCQACHGCDSRRMVVRPPINPNANDNLTATQLQGHPGTIMECSTCHSGSTGNNLNGPHGMHPVATAVGSTIIMTWRKPPRKRTSAAPVTA